MFRSLAKSFVRSSYRGEMRDQLQVEGESPKGEKPPVNRFLQAIARFGGLFLSARNKTRIQGYLINRYQLPVSFVPPEQLQMFFESAVQKLIETVGRDNLGDYLEFGVYQGNSTMAMHAALEKLGMHGVRLFGFDSFEGLPNEAEWDGPWSEGEFRSDLEFTRKRLTDAGIDWNRTFLEKGFFCDTLTQELRDRHGIE